GSGELIPISTTVVSGAIERSNVNSVSSLVRMISVEREFQTLTRVIHAYREADEGIISAASNS
ncbi:MAG: flagellar basal body rod C-terminal domain-containing protein, partial [Myxococcota bacterium]